MPKIEDYALLGDCEGSALVNKSGSIDWLCIPCFDSNACFSALLGDESNGYWKICPSGEFRTERRYRGDTLILETTFFTASGSARLTDWMMLEEEEPTLMRIIEGVEGTVEIKMEYVPRFDFGSIVPWVSRTKYGSLLAIAGPDSLELQATIPMRGEGLKTISQFQLKKDETHEFALIWRPSNIKPTGKIYSCRKNFPSTERWWADWIAKCTYEGKYSEVVKRSLLTLKALTYRPTGGIVAAPTTSLPESIGGSRNWDYRYCWVRDSTFSLYALLSTGFTDEARSWRSWLERAVAGTPSEVNIMYGIFGERRLDELELGWLAGYENSVPVRVGNAAYKQTQLDIFGEVMDTLHLGRLSALEADETAWGIQIEMLKFVEKAWKEPDEGIWEIRGERQHFVHSKVMAWVAMDRAIKSSEKFGLAGPVEKWKTIRQEIKDSVLKNGFNQKLNSFTQYYGSTNVDASLLMLPLVGFLLPDDSRIRGTVERIEKELFEDGLLLRYRSELTPDGIKEDEGCFLACSFWLVDNYVLLHEEEKAITLFEKLIALANDLQLMAEQYDTKRKRLVGNFPQALTHIAIVNSAINLTRPGNRPAEHRQYQD